MLLFIGSQVGGGHIQQRHLRHTHRVAQDAIFRAGVAPAAGQAHRQGRHDMYERELPLPNHASALHRAAAQDLPSQRLPCRLSCQSRDSEIHPQVRQTGTRYITSLVEKVKGTYVSSGCKVRPSKLVKGSSPVWTSEN